MAMKRLLIVVDYQKDFVSGSLGFEKAKLLERRICEKIETYHAAGDRVIFTLDTHSEGYLNLQEGRQLPIPHCIKGTDGWGLYGDVAGKVSKEDILLEKDTFGARELPALLLQGQFEQIELVGVVSNICVMANAVVAKTALPEARITVDASCTASNDDVLHEKALDVMASLQIEILHR